MKDPKAIRKAIMTAKSIAAMVDPHFARVPLPEIGEPAPDFVVPERFAAGGYADNGMPDTSGLTTVSGEPEFYHNPLPHDVDAWTQLHVGRSQRENEGMVKRTNAAHAAAHEEVLPISSLIGIEDKIGKRALHTPSRELPFVEHSGGKFYVRDGNHRVVSEYLKGSKSIKVKIADLDAFNHLLHRADGGRAGSDDGGMPDDGRDLNKFGLYSHAAEQAGSLARQDSPESYKSMLLKRGVKPAEFEWSGYDKAFAGQPQITREQVAEHFQKNMPDLFETQYGGEADPKEFQALQERHGHETRENSLNRALAELHGREYEGETYAEMLARHRAERSNLRSEPFHEDYTIPGGSNYREVLIQNNAFGGFPGVQGHFGGAPDIIASLRMKDRRDREGNKILHLDELQSDWAQQGRKKGFDDDAAAERHKAAKKEYDDFLNRLADAEVQRRFQFLKEDFPDVDYEDEKNREGLIQLINDDVRRRPQRWLHLHVGMLDEFGRIRDAYHAAMDADRLRSSVKKAAYVTKTDDWVDLGLKRALQEAAKGDYDKLALSTGDVHADRYDLSKHIKEIHHEKNDDGTYNLVAYGHNRDKVYDEDDIPEEKLEDLLGKEMAQKVISGEGQTGKEEHNRYEQAKEAHDQFVNNFADQYADKEVAESGIEGSAGLRNALKKAVLKAFETGQGHGLIEEMGLENEYWPIYSELSNARTEKNLALPYSPYRDWRKLSGLDLKVGGEGMRKFYDEMLPKRLLKLAKQHEPETRLSSTEIVHPKEHGDDDYQPDVRTNLHSIDITPRMRESILKKGFAAYASGGEVDGYADGGMPQNPMTGAFEAENVPSVTVSPRPGKMGGYPVRAGTMDEQEPWSYTTPQGEDQPMPPPVQHPVFNEPRMDKIHKATHKIFKSKGFNDLTEELTGLRNFTVKPIIGTWKGEIEPSFHISHPNMTPEAAEKLSHLLGFGFMQDAAVKGLHNPNPENEGIPSVYMGHNKKLSKSDLDRIHKASREEGLDFSQTSDGRGVKFMHFGDEGDEFDKFAESVKRVADKTGLPHLYHVNTSGDLNYAQDYLKGIFGPHEGEAGELGDLSSPARPSDLFGRVVNHIISPYAKAVASEGYRLSPDRLRDTYGLSDEEHEQVRKALLPRSKDRTVIPLMEGEESLDIRPTGDRGKATVGDALFALQNRAAAHGQIEPGDFSKEAMEKIAQDIAKEVNYHVDTADKSAIGWYDAALKKAMNAYEGVFPELKTDDDKRMLFHAILGITSQGNDVHSNSVHTARLYNLLRDDGMTLPEGVEKLKGTFGDKTRAIEQNLLKFHHLVDANGYDKMRDLFSQKKSVSQWNKILKDNPDLHGPDGNPLSMQGGANQKVTGWTVFGPKIGSFINNLSGDYSTLTADLWFSRTWNRLLGHNFIHTPLAEAKQYQDFRDALVAEHAHHNPDQALGEAAEGKTSNGEVAMRNGKPIPWEHGQDVAGMGRDEVDALINDPDKMLEMAKTLSDRYRKGGFKDKSDLRRRAKNWMENRELPVAAPRGNSERDFQQNTVERSQRILKNKYGKNITVADIQAALWFLEKDLFGKMGVASEKAAPADYADAAANTINLINNGSLYNVKSRPGQSPQIAKAYGGSIRKAMTVLPVPHARTVRSALMIAKGLKKK